MAIAKNQNIQISLNHYIQEGYFKAEYKDKNKVGDILTKKELVDTIELYNFLSFFNESISSEFYIIIKEIFNKNKKRKKLLIENKRRYKFYCEFNDKEFKLADYLKRY
ncbi:hypothetical protein ACM39_14725 [Chryseobacterium sp. FH2]|uniref:hypothetical protein n=1 Tax=Chryseobacterium sp. FH2 TaxID=1674291 RepID=UPI00065AA9F1|nr:hypothetical protein [Chryseobacterium sp. FH2]KMQ67046.1 hypothetical protein ACM39_14725 [Chryseobacterium sp. FH2]